MNITMFTKPKGIITITFALVFMIDPNMVFQFFGMELNDAGILMSRILGGCYLGSGIGIWSINSVKDISTQSAWWYAAGEIIACIAFVIAMQNQVLNPFGWLLPIAYAFFGFMFIWVASETKKPALG